MAMLEEHRNAVYNYFAPRLGKEATQAMLSYFPARDVDEPATKADVALVRAEIELVRSEIELVRSEIELVRSEIEVVRSEIEVVRAESTAVEARLQAHIERTAREVTTQLTNRMLTVAGLGLAAITGLLAVFT